MVKQLSGILLLAVAGCADASIIINQNIGLDPVYEPASRPANRERIYVCTLTPFSDVYADAGRSERSARHKVSQRCEQGQGNGSIFCKTKDAVCTATSLDEDDGHAQNVLMIFDGSHQRGASLAISRDMPDLARYGFADRLSSFSIPDGWTVRFYEGISYTGGYYTRQGGDQEAIDFDNKIRSIRILKR